MKQLLGKNIVKRRHELKMTQQQLAELSDLSINFVSRLERGGSNDVSSTTLLKLSTALGTSMDALIKGEADSSHPQEGPHLKKLIETLEQYDYQKSERLSKAILELLNNK
jgi:transcriptional regulator with XRE-family HTH domain